MTTDPPMPMIIICMVEPVIVEDELVADSKVVVVNENTPEKPQVDDHKSKEKRGITRSSHKY